MKVSVLGATGLVGQKLVEWIEADEELSLGDLVASERRVGLRYGQTVQWRMTTPITPAAADKQLVSFADVEGAVVSALPSDVARLWEPRLAEKGCQVFSNASAFRLRKDVPLIIPELNPDHLDGISQQTTPGFIVTNPNCSTVFLAMALFPILSAVRLMHVHAVTLQAASGAGLPGVSAVDLLGSVIPHIEGEEAKMESEVLKILGDGKQKADWTLVAQANRVPVVHGHHICLCITPKNRLHLSALQTLYQDFSHRYPRAWCFWEEPDMPATSRALQSQDMRTHIGRLRVTDQGQILLVALGHNLVRGAAGAALANLKLWKSRKISPAD